MSNEDSETSYTPYTKLRNTLKGIKRSAERGYIDDKEANKKRSKALTEFKEEEKILSERRNKEINELLCKHDMKLLERGSREFDIVQDAIYCASEQWESEGRECMLNTISQIELKGIIVKLVDTR